LSRERGGEREREQERDRERERESRREREKEREGERTKAIPFSELPATAAAAAPFKLNFGQTADDDMHGQAWGQGWIYIQYTHKYVMFMFMYVSCYLAPGWVHKISGRWRKRPNEVI
jgi:hypothetical protein